MSAARLLLVEDDPVFGPALQRALTRRGVDCDWVDAPEAALAALAATRYRYAVLDLKLGERSGLQLIEPLRQGQPDLRILLLTGYASVATAVEAIKRGAVNYLPKPASADAILAALREDEDAAIAPGPAGATPAALQADAAHESSADHASPPSHMTPLHRLEWEHIQQALTETQGNLSAAARLLGMHRRSLQRKLKKRPSPGTDDTRA